MFSVSQAMTQAINAVNQGQADWNDLCLSFVAHMYGFDASGVSAPKTAINFWNTVAKDKHPGDQNPPPGALVFWNVGQAGHVAISLGGGEIVTTHTEGGTPVRMPLAKANSQLGESVGWAAPVFPSGNGQTPTGWQTTTVASSGPAPAQPVSDIPGTSIPNPFSLGSAISGLFSKLTWIFLPSSWIRIQSGIAGVVLIVIAVVLFARESAG